MLSDDRAEPSKLRDRIVMAVKADSYFYHTLANQPERTREAVTVGIGSSLIMFLGLMLIRAISPAVWALAGLGWAAAMLGIGTWYLATVGRLMGGQGSYDQVLRALGFAMAPQALGFVPIADFILGFVAGAVWTTICTVVAVREVHQIPTQTAVGLVVVPILLVIGSLPFLALSFQSAA
jgi:hypothetical protein